MLSSKPGWSGAELQVDAIYPIKPNVFQRREDVGVIRAFSCIIGGMKFPENRMETVLVPSYVEEFGVGLITFDQIKLKV